MIASMTCATFITLLALSVPTIAGDKPINQTNKVRWSDESHQRLADAKRQRLIDSRFVTPRGIVHINPEVCRIQLTHHLIEIGFLRLSQEAEFVTLAWPGGCFDKHTDVAGSEVLACKQTVLAAGAKLGIDSVFFTHN